MKVETAFRLRPTTCDDGAAAWELVRRAGSLDLNSAYCYLLLCDLYSDTCLVAEDGERVVGFISALVPPGRQDVLFIWQVAVDPDYRGQGLARQMLDHLLVQSSHSIQSSQSIRYVEATVGPSNTASRALFESFARRQRCGVQVLEQQGYPEKLFPQAQAHEAEPLLRIGPLSE